MSQNQDYTKHFYSPTIEDKYNAILDGAPKIDGCGKLLRGLVVRHLVLPSHRGDSVEVLNLLEREIGHENMLLSLMSQYTPDFCPPDFKEIKRRVTSFEYNSVVDKALTLGYDGYIQDISSSNKIYTPDFLGDNKK